MARRLIRLTNPKATLFYICYTIFLFSVMFRSVLGIAGITRVLYMFCLIGLLLLFVITIIKIPKKYLLMILAITIILFISKIYSGSNDLIIPWLLIVAAKGIKFDDIVKYDLKIKILMLLIVVVLYFCGLTEVNLHFRNGALRHSMGFSNPNVFSGYIMSIAVEVLFLHRKNLNILDILFSLFTIVIIDYYADSRTQVYCISLLIVVFIYKYMFKSKKARKSELIPNRFGSFPWNYSFLIMMTLSLFFSISYTGEYNKYNTFINAITSGRIEAASHMMEKYDVTYFGQKIEFVTRKQALKSGKQIQTLDNAYVYLLLAFGIIPTILYCYFMKEYMKSAKSENDILAYIMFVYMISGLMEHYLLLPQFNIFLLYYSYILFENKIKYIGENLDVAH